jgi:hypothetical protein
MPNDINTYPVQQFLENIRIAEMTNQKEIKLDIKTARVLAYNIGEVLAKVNQDYNELLTKLQSNNNEVIELRMDGGGFK